MIAAVVPYGFLKGYAEIYRPCLESMARELDRVYCILSTRDDAGYFDGFPDNVRLVSDTRSWFVRVDGADVFDMYRLTGNMDYGYRLATQDGADRVVFMFCNWYVPPGAGEYLRSLYVASLEWLYRRDCLAGQMFHADRRLPYIVRAGRDFHMDLNRVWFEGVSLEWEAYDFQGMDAAAVIEYGHEATVEATAERRNFMRCYNDVLPSRRPVFDWSFWKSYYARKYAGLSPSDDPSPLNVTVPESCSVGILEELNGQR
jgi:hypothetical protein